MNNKTNTEIICETIVVVAYYALVFLLTFALLCVRIEAEPVQGYRLA